MEFFRSKIALRYILLEMIPTFIIGVIVFVLILLMFQALRLTEFVIVHGVSLTTMLQMMGYLSISFLPIIFPMSLLFTVLMAYGRLSGDSEIVALRSIGIGMPSILAPALLLSIVIGILSAQTSFQIAPWGNRQFELLITKIGSSRAAVTIREGTFSEGFFDLVVYANRVDSKTGTLEGIFIYDERVRSSPVTIVAKQGQLLSQQSDLAHTASLRLVDGDLHRTTEGGRHTKIHFKNYDIFLNTPIEQMTRNKSNQSLTLNEILQLLRDTTIEPGRKRQLSGEFHKRWALATACILFALLGVGLGTQTNKRSGRSSGFVLSLVVLVSYWLIYAASEGGVRNSQLPVSVLMWSANLLFTFVSVYFLRRVWH